MAVRRRNRGREWADTARKALKERDKCILQLSGWGWTTREIGAEVRLSHTAVAKILRK